MIKSILVVILFFSSPLSAEIYRDKHDNFIKLLSPKIQESLIIYGYCHDINDCNKRGLFFFGPGKTELNISMYSIKRREIVRDIINSILIIYEELNFKNSVLLEVYDVEHPKNSLFFKNLFSKNKPFVTVSIKEK